MITERMVGGGLLRNGKDGGLEGDLVEGTRRIYISICQFEGIIGAIERMRR